MPRTARKRSESGFYHIICRGSARQIIFEDNDDRAFFMERLSSLLSKHAGMLVCWCLMDNHVHLIVRVELSSLSTLMHALLTSYSGYFNRVHRRTGPLFEGRFKSEAIETDEHLLSAIRYVHRNPIKAGICEGLSYAWSSYDEIFSSHGWAERWFVRELFGDEKGFRFFHEAEEETFRFSDVDEGCRVRLTDAKAREVALDALGGADPTGLLQADRNERDAALAHLKGKGLSVRQIQRLTGLSLGTISNAGK